MRLFLAVLPLMAVLCSAAHPSYELMDYDPVANADATVVSGNARFTVLTDRVIRMEYDPNGKFEDRATLAVLNRNVSVPKFNHTSKGGTLTIQTGAITLAYVEGKPFSADSLSVSGTGSGAFNKWQPGMANHGNLLGTIKSLDELGVQSLNCTIADQKRVHDESLHCEWGLVSRDGWSILNDTDNWCLTKGAEWWDSPNADSIDWYIFAHGHDYKGAIADYVKIGGKVAMVPRYASGLWWTRWYDLNNADVKQIVSDYENHFLPLDVFVFDMDFHSKYHWGGYTFDRHLFPNPEDTLGYLRDRNLHVAANLHDDDGVHNSEEMFTKMCRALGLDPMSTDSIPFSIVNKTYVYNMEDIVLGHLESIGISFWWIDWQQGGTQGGAKGGKQNPTIWLDKIRVTDPKRRGSDARGMVLARFGGLGNHRYQVGFSGDVAGLTWQNLAYQPYFTMTSSNVAYGFWSHDIEGPAFDHEMYVRWIQWATYSPIFRSHERGSSAGGCADDNPNSCSTVRPWNVPDKYFEANRQAVQTRAELVPYIYTRVREAFDSGLGIMRPMYYEFPESKEAYYADENGNFPQYFFGPDMFVSPIVSPANMTNMTKAAIWIPPGLWVEESSGMLRDGGSSGQIMTKLYPMTEIPVFIRAGAVIPRRPLKLGNTVGLATQQYDALVFDIYPGATSGSGKVYEDDGNTTAYLQGAYVWTTLTYSRTNTSLTANISSSGSFAQFPKKRFYTLRIMNGLAAVSVSVNGKALSPSRAGGSGTYSYDGFAMSTVIDCDELSTGSPVTIVVNFVAASGASLSGLKGLLQRGQLAKRNLDEDRSTPAAHKPNGGFLMSLASMADSLGYVAASSPDDFEVAIGQVPVLFQQALDELVNGTAASPSTPLPDNMLIQLYDDDEEDSVLCGCWECLQDNSAYSKMRIEGYMPGPSSPGTVPLYLYWNQVQTSSKDNWVTTTPTAPQGYIAGDFVLDGQVFAKQRNGTAPLQLWFKQSANDHLTVASDDGIAWAKNHGYKLVDSALGYVYKTDPYGPPPSMTWKLDELRLSRPQLGRVERKEYSSMMIGDDNPRLAYSIALLQSAQD